MGSTPAGHASGSGAAPRSTQSRLAQLREVLEPVVTAAGADLEDVRSQPAGKRQLVKVVVDRDGGIGLDDIAELSRTISERLDEANLTGDAPYVLEVSSPGVDRPLTAPRHWRRATGRLVRVRFAGDGGDLVGRVLDAEEAGATLDVDGQPRRVGYDEVASARVQVEFTRRDGEPDASGIEG